MSVAVQLVAQIEDAVRGNGLSQITKVKLDVGEMQLIVPEALVAAFESAAAGTVSEGARLLITEVPAEASCRACGHKYIPDIANYTCPECLKADAEIVSGKDVILTSIEGETEE